MSSNFPLPLNKKGFVDFEKLETLNLIYIVGLQSSFVDATKIDILLKIFKKSVKLP
jgi:hypothetical protein